MDEKLSSSIYRKNTQVTELVDRIEAIAIQNGIKLSRWQTNQGNFSTTITYALHTGERSHQARYQSDIVGPIVVLNQSEGTTTRCEAYRKLDKMLKFIETISVERN